MFAEPDVFEALVSPLHGHHRIHAEQFTGVSDLMDAVHARVQRFVFRHVADALPDARPLGSDVMAQNMALSGGHLDEAEEGFEQRRFPCAVGAQQPRGACLDLKIEGVQRHMLPVGFGQRLRVHDGCTRFDHGRRLAWRAFQPDPNMDSRRGLQATTDAHRDALLHRHGFLRCALGHAMGDKGAFRVEHQAGDARTQVL